MVGSPSSDLRVTLSHLSVVRSAGGYAQLGRAPSSDKVVDGEHTEACSYDREPG